MSERDREELDSALIEQQFLEFRDSGALPSPAGVGMSILCLTQRDDCSLDDIAETIMADPALTGQILKVANQGVNGPAEAISTVKEAAVRLGMKTVSHVGLSFTLLSGNRSGTCARFDYGAFWSWCLACAVSAQLLGRRLGAAEPAQLFTGGILMRVGELALASVHPDEYARILDAVQMNPGLDVRALEAERFKICQNEVASALLRDWGLPAGLAAAVGHARGRTSLDRLEGSERGLVQILRGAACLAEFLVESKGLHHQHLGDLEQLRQDLGVGPEAFHALCDEVSREWCAWGEILRVQTQPLPSYGELRSRAAVVERPRESRSEQGQHILAVDDDPLSLKLLAKHLESGGHTVTTASNGKQALALALETSPQIVVTDWMMPELDGLEFTRALRRFGSGRTIYVLVLTSQEQEERVVEAFEAGVDDYVTKPFNPKVLLARVRAGQRVVKLQEQVEADKQTRREQVASLAVMTRKLRAAAMTDPLTELPNRRYAMKRLEEEWASGARSVEALSAVLIDIDHFKGVNDRYGHDAGDRVLRRVAKVIDRTTRDGDVTARIGGEEFLVICPNTGMEGAARCADRVREAVEQHFIGDPEVQVPVTVSAGVSTRGLSGCDSIDALLKGADEATYRAKDAGRNTVRVHGHGEERRRSA